MCIFLSKRFVFGGKNPEAVKGFAPDWMMAWSKEEIKLPNMIFEICNFLFNYAILNMNQSVMFLKDKQGVEQYKNCLQKLQYVENFYKGCLGSSRNSEVQSTTSELHEITSGISG